MLMMIYNPPYSPLSKGGQRRVPPLVRGDKRGDLPYQEGRNVYARNSLGSVICPVTALAAAV
jgi:hypothetical protein